MTMLAWPNKITGANAGGPRQLPMRTRWAARVARFGRYTATHDDRRSTEGAMGSYLLIIDLTGAASKKGVSVGAFFENPENWLLVSRHSGLPRIARPPP